MYEYIVIHAIQTYTWLQKQLFCISHQRNIANLDKHGVHFDKNLRTWQANFKETLMDQVGIPCQQADAGGTERVKPTMDTDNTTLQVRISNHKDYY